MADSRSFRVGPGEKVRWSAQTLNDVLAAGRAHRDDTTIPGGARPFDAFRQSGIIQVLNDTGIDLDRFSVVELTDPIIDPDTNSLEFQERVRMKGDIPTDSETACLAIYLDAVGPGEIGRAIVSGIVPCWLDVTDSEYTTCSPVEGVTDHMVTVESDGICDVVYVNDDAGGFVETAGSGEPGSSSYKLAYVMLRGCGRPPPNGISGSGCIVTFVSCVMLQPPGGSGLSGSGPGPCGYDLVVEYTEYDLANCSVLRTWCEYNPTDCCTETTDLITTTCCSDGIPRTLSLTGPCLPGEGVSLTYNSGNSTWISSPVDMGGGVTLTFYMNCTGTGASAWSLSAACSTPGGGFSASPMTHSCDPVDLRFQGSFSECGTCPTEVVVEFVVTE